MSLFKQTFSWIFSSGIQIHTIFLGRIKNDSFKVVPKDVELVGDLLK